jgi:hypothetical protein
MGIFAEFLNTWILIQSQTFGFDQKGPDPYPDSYIGTGTGIEILPYPFKITKDPDMVSAPHIMFCCYDGGLVDARRDEHIVHVREQAKQQQRLTNRDEEDEGEEEEATAFEKAYNTVTEGETPEKGWKFSMQDFRYPAFRLAGYPVKTVPLPGAKKFQVLLGSTDNIS